MNDHKHILQSLVLGVGGEDAVTVRETNFGYIVHSVRGARDSEIRRLFVRFALVMVWVAVAGLWLMPVNALGVAGKLVLTGLLLAAAYVVRLLTQDEAGGYELHVDTARRELRSAVQTSKGASWIKNSARFNEVTAPIMQKGRYGADKRSLCLRIAGEAELMPVAIGNETTLLAVYDRLMRDLRPLEERLAGFRDMRTTVKSTRRKVFPALGPEEKTA